jgi:hypothetical protein
VVGLFAVTRFGRSPPRVLDCTNLVLPGSNLPRRSYDWRSPSRCVPSSGARRRSRCAVGSIPPHAFRFAGAAAFLVPVKVRAAVDSELLIRCSKRLGLRRFADWHSPSLRRRAPFTCPFAWSFVRLPRQVAGRRPFASPRSVMRSLRSAHFPRTRHARTRLCHRTLPMPCIPTWSFSPALDPMKFRAACPRGAFDPARVRRPVARAMVTKSGVVHATVARRAAPSYFADLTRALCSHVVPAGGALDSPSASVSPPTL